MTSKIVTDAINFLQQNQPPEIPAEEEEKEEPSLVSRFLKQEGIRKYSSKHANLAREIPVFRFTFKERKFFDDGTGSFIDIARDRELFGENVLSGFIPVPDGKMFNTMTNRFLLQGSQLANRLGRTGAVSHGVFLPFQTRTTIDGEIEVSKVTFNQDNPATDTEIEAAIANVVKRGRRRRYIVIATYKDPNSEEGHSKSESILIEASFNEEKIAEIIEELVNELRTRQEGFVNTKSDGDVGDEQIFELEIAASDESSSGGCIKLKHKSGLIEIFGATRTKDYTAQDNNCLLVGMNKIPELQDQQREIREHNKQAKKQKLDRDARAKAREESKQMNELEVIESGGNLSPKDFKFCKSLTGAPKMAWFKTKILQIGKTDKIDVHLHGQAVADYYRCEITFINDVNDVIQVYQPALEEGTENESKFRVKMRLHAEHYKTVLSETWFDKRCPLCGHQYKGKHECSEEQESYLLNQIRKKNKKIVHRDYKTDLKLADFEILALDQVYTLWIESHTRDDYITRELFEKAFDKFVRTYVPHPQTRVTEFIDAPDGAEEIMRDTYDEFRKRLFIPQFTAPCMTYDFETIRPEELKASERKEVVHEAGYKYRGVHEVTYGKDALPEFMDAAFRDHVEVVTEFKTGKEKFKIIPKPKYIVAWNSSSFDSYMVIEEMLRDKERYLGTRRSRAMSRLKETLRTRKIRDRSETKGAPDKFTAETSSRNQLMKQRLEAVGMHQKEIRPQDEPIDYDMEQRIWMWQLEKRCAHPPWWEEIQTVEGKNKITKRKLARFSRAFKKILAGCRYANAGELPAMGSPEDKMMTKTLDFKSEIMCPSTEQGQAPIMRYIRDTKVPQREWLAVKRMNRKKRARFLKSDKPFRGARTHSLVYVKDTHVLKHFLTKVVPEIRKVKSPEKPSYLKKGGRIMALSFDGTKSLDLCQFVHSTLAKGCEAFDSDFRKNFFPHGMAKSIEDTYYKGECPAYSKYPASARYEIEHALNVDLKGKAIKNADGRTEYKYRVTREHSKLCEYEWMIANGWVKNPDSTGPEYVSKTGWDKYTDTEEAAHKECLELFAHTEDCGIDKAATYKKYCEVEHPDGFDYEMISKEYVTNDVNATDDILLKLGRAMFIRCGLDIRDFITLPASAFTKWETTIPKDTFIHVPTSEDEYGHTNPSVYGGRTSPFMRYFKSKDGDLDYTNINDYIMDMDLVSMYASVMHKHSFQQGASVKLRSGQLALVNAQLQTFYKTGDLERFTKTFTFGSYNCDVFPNRDMVIPALAMKDERGSTVWDLHDRKDQKYQMTDILTGLKYGYKFVIKSAFVFFQRDTEKMKFSKHGRIFKEYIDVLYAGKQEQDKLKAEHKELRDRIDTMEANLKKNDMTAKVRDEARRVLADLKKQKGKLKKYNQCLREVDKLMMNALYGKNCQKRIQEETAIITTPEALADFNRRYRPTGFMQVDENRVIMTGENRTFECTISKPIHVGAEILAQTRVMLNDLFDLVDPTRLDMKRKLPEREEDKEKRIAQDSAEVEQTGIYYCDTDSIFIHATRYKFIEHLCVKRGELKQLGQLDDELDGGKIIEAIFISPKTYALKYVTPKGEIKYKFRAKGISRHLLTWGLYKVILMKQGGRQEFEVEIFIKTNNIKLTRNLSRMYTVRVANNAKRSIRDCWNRRSYVDEANKNLTLPHGYRMESGWTQRDQPLECVSCEQSGMKEYCGETGILFFSTIKACKTHMAISQDREMLRYQGSKYLALDSLGQLKTIVQCTDYKLSDFDVWDGNVFVPFNTRAPAEPHQDQDDVLREIELEEQMAYEEMFADQDYCPQSFEMPETADAVGQMKRASETNNQTMMLTDPCQLDKPHAWKTNPRFQVVGHYNFVTKKEKKVRVADCLHSEKLGWYLFSTPEKALDLAQMYLNQGDKPFFFKYTKFKFGVAQNVESFLKGVKKFKSRESHFHAQMDMNGDFVMYFDIDKYAPKGEDVLGPILKEILKRYKKMGVTVTRAQLKTASANGMKTPKNTNKAMYYHSYRVGVYNKRCFQNIDQLKKFWYNFHDGDLAQLEVMGFDTGIYSRCKTMRVTGSCNIGDKARVMRGHTMYFNLVADQKTGYIPHDLAHLPDAPEKIADHGFSYKVPIPLFVQKLSNQYGLKLIERLAVHQGATGTYFSVDTDNWKCPFAGYSHKNTTAYVRWDMYTDEVWLKCCNKAAQHSGHNVIQCHTMEPLLISGTCPEEALQRLAKKNKAREWEIVQEERSQKRQDERQKWKDEQIAQLTRKGMLDEFMDNAAVRIKPVEHQPVESDEEIDSKFELSTRFEPFKAADTIYETDEAALKAMDDVTLYKQHHPNRRCKHMQIIGRIGPLSDENEIYRDKKTKQIWFGNQAAGFEFASLRGALVLIKYTDFMYSAVHSLEAFIDLNKRTPKARRHYYDLSYPGNRTIPYWDIDLLTKSKDGTQAMDIVKAVLAQYELDFKCRLTKADYVIIDSSGDKGDNYKNSFHLYIVNGDYFVNNHDQLKYIRHTMMSGLLNKWFEPIAPSQVCGKLDGAVYSKNRAFRMSGSVKESDPKRVCVGPTILRCPLDESKLRNPLDIDDYPEVMKWKFFKSQAWPALFPPKQKKPNNWATSEIVEIDRTFAIVL